MTHTIDHKIKDLADEVVQGFGMYVVEVEIKSGSETEVWVLVDSESGSKGLDDFAQISQELSLLLEANEVFEQKYRLNISSPGLGRPLSDIRQYKKNIGRKIRVKFLRDEKSHKAEGVLFGLNEDSIQVESAKQKIETIRLDEIVEAKIIPIFK